MPTIEEKNKETGEGLAFDFHPNWQVVKYDQQENLAANAAASFYRQVIEKGGVQRVQGMDIVCRLPTEIEQLQFIEIKDERKRNPAKSTSKRHDKLYKAVLRKTIGTLAGLTLAERLGHDSLRPLACLSRQPAIEVILFLVEPPQLPVPDVGSKRTLRRVVRQQRKTTLDQRLTAKLEQWGLPFKLYNLTNRLPPDWQVRDLA
ncbi:hypothetical protein [Hymenobacter psoromatis]|uniref:hypothetical protein n=1 Tax=Hymenobacter psoromatis TaxID=1484116 RepID=UPI001CBDEBC8|nr:hypothetical protein [Hymenobacter psoromatis]